jgi:hypothetical protein
MTNSGESRSFSRQHVLLLAQLRLGGGSPHRIRVRDLSAKGLRAEGDVSVTPGQLVEVDFGSAGRVSGVIAWHDHPTFGVTLEHEIEPAVVRHATIQKCEGSYEAPRFVRPLAQIEEICGPARKV